MGSKVRYTVVGVLVMAACIAIALSHGLSWIWAQSGLDDMTVISQDLPITTVIGYALGAGGALFVLKHKPTFQIANEVVDELSKVTWPTREETGNATLVVIVTVLVCSAYLGIFDAMWLWVTDWILGVPRGTAG